MKQRTLVIILAVIAVLGSASGWVYHAIADKKDLSISQSELMNLQVSFLKQYGSQATITEAINPKIYEVAWTDGQNTKNVSVNIGGVWVLIASVPAPTTTPSGGK